MHSAVSVPHCDGAGNDALYCTLVEIGEYFGWHAKFLQLAYKVQSFVCLADELLSVVRPGKILINMGFKIFKVFNSVNCSLSKVNGNVLPLA